MTASKHDTAATRSAVCSDQLLQCDLQEFARLEDHTLFLASRYYNQINNDN